MAIQTSPSGSPDENESRETEAVRHEDMARTRASQVLNLRPASGDGLTAPVFTTRAWSCKAARRADGLLRRPSLY